MSTLPIATSFLQSESFIYVLYIVAFALFIQGLRGLAGPTTAVRGNRIAAVGMAIAVVATLLNPGEGNWGLIVLGVALGAAVGVPAARNVKMTAMPQMVALFNGVGGGAVALISLGRVPPLRLDLRLAHGPFRPRIWATASSCRAAPRSRSAACRPTSRSSRCSRRSSARSPSGARTSPSASSRKSSPGGRSASAPRQQIVNLVLLILALAAGVDLVAGAHSAAAVHRDARRAPRCSATPSCCRSAAPTCRS